MIKKLGLLYYISEQTANKITNAIKKFLANFSIDNSKMSIGYNDNKLKLPLHFTICSWRDVNEGFIVKIREYIDNQKYDFSVSFREIYIFQDKKSYSICLSVVPCRELVITQKGLFELNDKGQDDKAPEIWTPHIVLAIYEGIASDEIKEIVKKINENIKLPLILSKMVLFDAYNQKIINL